MDDWNTALMENSSTIYALMQWSAKPQNRITIQRTSFLFLFVICALIVRKYLQAVKGGGVVRAKKLSWGFILVFRINRISRYVICESDFSCHSMDIP